MSNKKRKNSRYADVAAKIDNTAPHFDASIHLKANSLEQDAMRITQIDKDNIELLKKMNIIHRLGGYVDCWIPDVKYKSKFKDQDYKNHIIMKKNKVLLKKIEHAKSQYPTRTFLKSWKGMRERFTSTFERPSVVLDVQKKLSEKSRTKCFFDIGLKEENQKLGRIVFELYDTLVPRTCENFIAFCRGANGLSYKHTLFHRIVAGYWCQGGDVTKFDGTGGTSIYGDSFDKEKVNLCHIGPGILSTCENDDGKNDSKFNITFKCLKTVDEKNIVFGRVIDGMINVFKIEAFGTKTGKPIKSVIVLNCGVLPSKCAHKNPVGF